jgi:hypothetical protein
MSVNDRILHFQAGYDGRHHCSGFHVARGDSAAASIEIWPSYKNAMISLYRVITVVKIIEIIRIGFFLSSAPDLFNFLSKALAKVAKI